MVCEREMVSSPVNRSFAAIFLAALHLNYFVTGAKPTALFVFGDSYADTGNHNSSDPIMYASWRPPYGHTWSRRPSGRYSDGRVLTDFIASSLSFSSPVTYRMMRISSPERIATGINFAFGGSGVFPTFGPQFPNVSAQIAQLHEIIDTGMFPKEVLKSSLALVVVAGNDYTAYRLEHPMYEGVEYFSPRVVDEIGAALRKLYNLGFRRFAVTNLALSGCVPAATSTSNYTACNENVNAISAFHNELLSNHISNLKKVPEAKFIILDLYSAFSSALGKTFPRHGNAKLLQPCCEGIGNSFCGDVDSEGRALYTVCCNAKEAFYWDSAHPSQAGWEAVCKELPSLSF